MSRIFSAVTHRVRFIIQDAVWFNNFMAGPFGLALVILFTFVVPVTVAVFIVPIVAVTVVTELFGTTVQPQFLSIVAILALLWRSNKGDF